MTQWIVVLLICFTLLWPLARYGVFLLSNRRAGHLMTIRKRQGGLAYPIVRGMITAIMAEVVAVVTYPMGLFATPRPVTDGTPILLVHGLFHNASGWLVMKRRLARAGFDNLHTYQYNTFSGEFDDAVDGLQRELDRLLQASRTGTVLLVAHSLGGLVCRKAVCNPRFQGRVAGLVALGTPHGGSDLARFGGNRMSRDLIPGRYIQRAVDKVSDPDCPRLAIYNLVDDFVFPLHTLRPARSGWEEQVCSPMGHVWMLYSKEVTSMVVDFLRRTGAG